MARPFSFTMHAANIVTQPHSRDGYERLIRAFYSAKRPVKLRGDRYALITSLAWRRERGQSENAVATGTISTFTNVDLNAPWLNTETGAAAEDQETQTISIPPYLRPNLAQFNYWFDLKRHIMVIQGLSRMYVRGEGYKFYSMGPTLIQRYLDILATEKRALREFSRIDVTIVPDSQTVASILSSKGLRSLTITLKPPNPDTLGSVRARFMQRLNDMNAKSRIESYVALAGQDLKPDEDVQTVAKIAAANGRVDARILTATQGVVPVSTVGKAMVEKMEVDTDANSEQEIFEAGAANMVGKIVNAQSE